MNFWERVFECIKKIPKGKVVSYGQVASFCGSPRASRQVGWALRSLDGDNTLPWWRVVNREGHISVKGTMISTQEVQKALLEHEGVKVSEDYKLDIEKYRFNFFSRK